MSPSLIIMDPAQRAEALRRALEKYGIASKVYIGYGLAVASLPEGLVVWSDGWNYWWQVGWDAQHQRVIYARCPTTEPDRAARRVALRYAELRRRHPPAETVGSIS